MRAIGGGTTVEGWEARVRGGRCLTWPDARFVYVQYTRVRKQARGDDARDGSEKGNQSVLWFVIVVFSCPAD